MKNHSEVRYRTPLRWIDAAIIHLRRTRVGRGRLVFEALVRPDSTGKTVAKFTHRYAYINATTGRAETPEDWTSVVKAIRAYEPDVLIEES